MTAIALRRSQLGVNVAEINVGNPKVIEVAVRWLTQLLLLGDCDSQSETALPGSNHLIRTSVLQLLQGVHVRMLGRTQLSSIPIERELRNLNCLIQMFQ